MMKHVNFRGVLVLTEGFFEEYNSKKTIKLFGFTSSWISIKVKKKKIILRSLPLINILLPGHDFKMSRKARTVIWTELNDFCWHFIATLAARVRFASYSNSSNKNSQFPIFCATFYRFVTQINRHYVRIKLCNLLTFINRLSINIKKKKQNKINRHSYFQFVS